MDRSPEQAAAAPPFVIAIGTSAGGLAAMKEVVAQLPPDLPACVMAVLHVAPDASVSYFVRALQAAGAWDCREASDGDPLLAGRLYVAPADRHLLADVATVSVTKGPRENRWRPSIDALLRSAAIHHRGRAIGVLLTGELDDGVAGLAAIKRCGGVCVVQDPADAAFPSMPAAAIRRVEIDQVVPLGAIGKTVARLVSEGPGEGKDPPLELLAEARVAAGGRMTIEDMDGLGDRSAVTCPECGGILWKLGGETSLHFRCHTGHAFSPEALETDLTHRLEATLWSAVRLFEERRSLIQSLSKFGSSTSAESSRVEEIEAHLHLLRRVLLGPAGGDAAAQLESRTSA
ncbi:chemotaxis protein CheB [Luteolibacter sp. Populi]|uniref:chemotaxis protein CheB n=1 Tax=Luteolibacter sp. Populi TaxID=3230487 RepID=UPI0034676356